MKSHLAVCPPGVGLFLFGYHQHSCAMHSFPLDTKINPVKFQRSFGLSKGHWGGEGGTQRCVFGGGRSRGDNRGGFWYVWYLDAAPLLG